MSNTIVSKYVPSFLGKFWLSNHNQESGRVHIYDVYNNDLREVNHEIKQRSFVFQDLNTGSLDVDTRQLLHAAEESFSQLESATQSSLEHILDGKLKLDSVSSKISLPLSSTSVDELRKYFVFLRFRNSLCYQKIIEETYQNHDLKGNVFTFCQPLITQNRLRVILREFIKFFNATHSKVVDSSEDSNQAGVAADPFLQSMNLFCWGLYNAELCFGVATDEQEFIRSEQCFGSLDDGPEEENLDFFCPVAPTLALYLLKPLNDSASQHDLQVVWLDVGFESASDVHLRNTMILQTYPQYLYFRSLRTVALSISSYEEFRSNVEHIDYSRLKQRCRQKFLQETVTKTLVVKGSVILTDLTDEVVIMGNSAVAAGSFSDVWKGTWEDPIEKRPRTVALKFLRLVMVQNVREKLLERLQAEVLAWHRLCHRNINQLFGIVQSSHGIAMVSQWCDNGTVSRYLKNYPDADRLMLLTQVASGIAYLHNIKIIHGDLKGGNILVDKYGNAIITDFGLSKVVEDITDNMVLATSFFAGSTRWMAPELVFALVEDDGRIPPITTFSDVYAFASVCLELASDRLPYPDRSNDHAVTVDILRGIRPCRNDACLLKLNEAGEKAFWDLLDQCWSVQPDLRPTMTNILAFFEVLRAL